MIPEKKYSIEEFQFFFNYRFYLTKDRFYANLKVKLGWGDTQISALWKIFENWPGEMQKEENNKNIAFVLEICLPLLRELVSISEKNNMSGFNGYFGDLEKSDLRLFYIENRTESEDNGKVMYLDFNYLEPLSMLPYCEILKSGIKVIGISKFYEGFNTSNSKQKELKVYDGDFFTTNDNYWRDKKSNIYVVLNGKVHRLNYILGKGYLNSKYRLNIDDEQTYSSHVITGCETWKHIGNIYQDLVFLKD